MRRAVMLLLAIGFGTSARGAPDLAALEEKGRLALVGQSGLDVEQALDALAAALRGGRDTPTLRLLIGMALARRNDEAVEVGQHDAPIARLAASASGARAATLDTAGKARVWDVHGRKLVRELPGATSFVAFAGERLVTVGEGKARLWVADDQELELGEAAALTIRPDGRVLALASGPRIEVWDLGSLRRVAGFRAGAEPSTLRLHPRRPMLAALDGKSAEVQDFDGKPLASMPAEVLEFLPDTGALVRDHDRNEVLWDIDLWLPGRTGGTGDRAHLVGPEIHRELNRAEARLRHDGRGRSYPPAREELADGSVLEVRQRSRLVLAPPHAGASDVIHADLGAAALVPAPRGERLLGSIRLFDARRGTALSSFPGLTRTFTPDGSTVGSVEDAHTLWLWRAEDGAFLRTLAAGPAVPLEHARDVAFSADGALAVVAASTSSDAQGPRRSRVRVWDLRAGKLAAEHALPGEQVIFARPTPEGRRLVVWSVSQDSFPSSGPGTLRLLEGDRTRLHREGRGATVSADGSVVALRRDGGTIDLIATDGKALATVRSTEVPVLSSDGSRVALVGKESLDVTVCDTKSGRVLWSTPGDRRSIPGESVAFSPDGAFLASLGTFKVMLRESSSGRLLGERRLDGPARVLVVGPGPYVATASILWRPEPFPGTAAELDAILKDRPSR